MLKSLKSQMVSLWIGDILHKFMLFWKKSNSKIENGYLMKEMLFEANPSWYQKSRQDQFCAFRCRFDAFLLSLSFLSRNSCRRRFQFIRQ